MSEQGLSDLTPTPPEPRPHPREALRLKEQKINKPDSPPVEQEENQTESFLCDFTPVQDPPSKLPCSEQYSSRLAYVSSDGRNTNTPELKQSGQPGSGAADSSSLSKSSSMLDST